MSTEQNPMESPAQKPAHRRQSGLFWGLVLIVVGLVVFAQQTGILSKNFNWWAAFILIPAFGSFNTAYNAYRSSGKFNAAVRGAIGGGIVVLTVAIMFLLNLDWAVYWPLMVIVGGFSIFLNGFERTSQPGGFITVSLWIGLGAMFLGAGYLVHNLHILDPQAYFGQYKWWAVAILIPGIGALINALATLIGSGKFTGAVFGLSVFGLIVTATGVVALLGISWNYLGPILLIVVGLSVMLGIFSRKM